MQNMTQHRHSRAVECYLSARRAHFSQAVDIGKAKRKVEGEGPQPKVTKGRVADRLVPRGSVALCSPPSRLIPTLPTYPPPAASERGADWVPGAEWQQGDWTCRKCGNHNWRIRGFCNRGKCRAPRDENFRIGQDWYCKCGNFNKVFRTTCNRTTCGASRESSEQFR